MDLGIAGRRALVAAGTAGLGLAVARALGEAGVQVVICGRDEQRLASALELLRGTASGPPPDGLTADVSSVTGAQAFVEEGTRVLGGRLDILVCSSGGPPPGTPVGTTVEWNGQPQVKSFTTYHPCCASRVTNIHQMADDVRGTLVLPGERFSINDVVGERTSAKGYVGAGAIADGEHVEEIGGGVSQFATTMFNAAFFAGLPINTYQMHSEYFSRYPYGREATMGFPNPDLAWTNDTPYGILVWTSYTDTSLTVTLYSTQHAYGEQTGQTEGRSGNCTTVSTTRTIHYPDGTTGTDTFNGRYRDPGQTSC